MIWQEIDPPQRSELFDFTWHRYKNNDSGIEVVWLANRDSNRFFSLAFATPPPNDKGIPHILEHCLPMGSRKFQTDDLFIKLVQKNHLSFIQALTYPDKTIYTFASSNATAFNQVSEIFLDFIFHPLLEENKFSQEGWRIAQDNGGKYQITGVVYNEMKGANSNPESLLYRHLLKGLFPRSPYAFNSGGEVTSIPKLDFQELNKYYREHYHPSQGKLVLYGDLDIDFTLSQIYEATKNCTKSPVIKNQLIRPTYKPGQLTQQYQNDQDQSHLILGWMIDSNALDEQLWWWLFDYVVFNSEASTIGKPLRDAHLGEEALTWGCETTMQYPFIALGIKGFPATATGQIQSELANYIKKAVKPNPDLIASALNQLELNLRSIDNSGGFPKAFSLAEMIYPNWLYSNKPSQILKIEQDLKNLNKNTTQLTQSVVTCVNTQMTPERVSVVKLKPNSHLIQQELKQEQAQLQEKLRSIGPAKVNNNLKAYQNWQKKQQTTGGSPPTIHKRDLDKIMLDDQVIKTNLGSATLWNQKLNTNGLVYSYFSWNVNAISPNQLSLLPLLTSFLNHAGTKNRSSSQLTIVKDSVAREFYFFPEIITTKSGECKSFLTVKAIYLPGKETEIMHLLSDLIENLNIRSTEVAVILDEAISEHRDYAINNGSDLARIASLKEIHSSFERANLLYGLGQAFLLAELKKHSPQRTRERVLELMPLIFSQPSILFRGAEDLRVLQPLKLSTTTRAIESKVTFLPNDYNAKLIEIPLPISFAATSWSLKKVLSGADDLAAHLLTFSTLWNQIRAKGGAYGVSLQPHRFSGCLSATSYRDPTVLSSIKAFINIPRMLSQMVVSQKEIDESIIGRVGSWDSNLITPQDRVSFQRSIIFAETTLPQELDFRQEIINTKLPQLHKLGHDLEGYTPQIAAVGNSRQLKPISEQYELPIIRHPLF